MARCLLQKAGFDGRAAAHRALSTLTAGALFNFAPRAITVSTVGLPGAMRRLAQRFPGVRIALSLHTCRQSLREQLMPIARVHDLDALREVLVAFSADGRSVLIEVLLLGGRNDAPGDAAALAEFISAVSMSTST